MANSVYWVGADGNIWQDGINRGKALGTSDVGFDAATASGEARRIADPNPPKTAVTAPANPNATGSGSGSGTARADKSNDIALQLAGLGAVDSQTTTGLSAIDKALGGLRGQYDTETAANENTYKTSSDTNTGNLEKNKQTALVNAAQGRRGLFGTLSSLGALSGTGITLANQAVQKGANTDLGGADDSYKENQSTLDTSIGTYRAEDARRRQDAETAAENARTNTRGEAAKSRMSFYSNLANDYAAQLDPGNAKKYTDLAASLYPEMARTSIPSTNLGYSAAAFTPTTLANYMAGGNSTVVSATPTTGPGSLPGLVASPTKKKQTTV